MATACELTAAAVTCTRLAQDQTSQHFIKGKGHPRPHPVLTDGCQLMVAVDVSIILRGVSTKK